MTYALTSKWIMVVAAIVNVVNVVNVVNGVDGVKKKFTTICVISAYNE